LGIASLEDKIVQQAVVRILNQIYEVDFRGFSYGFRPRRSPHQALDALHVGITRKRVNWILDADRGFFTCAVSHPFDELATCSPLADAGAHDRHRMAVEVEKVSHRGWRSRAWAA
jgi:hypothetical protein